MTMQFEPRSGPGNNRKTLFEALQELRAAWNAFVSAILREAPWWELWLVLGLCLLAVVLGWLMGGR